MPVVPVLPGSSTLREQVLTAGAQPAAVARFLSDAAPAEVSSTLRQHLLPEDSDAVPRLVRAKLKPGRSLTAEFSVVLPSFGTARRLWVSWVAPGRTARGPADGVEAEALRRGVLAPFLRSWAGSDDGRTSVSVSPVDAAFPQLVRWHDRTYLAPVLRGSGVHGSDCNGVGVGVGEGGEAGENLVVDTVRYRVAQRHVLRIGTVRPGPAVYAKVYRDDTGRRAVDAAAAVARVLATEPGIPVSTGRGRYLADDRVALWTELPGRSLADEIARRSTAAEAAVRTAGVALRLLHDSTARPDVGGSAGTLPARPDAAAQVAETVRTAELVAGLAPALGDRLRRAAARTLELLTALPAEPPTLVHGDLKSDNVLVAGPRLHLLDLDRCGRGDPAADVGKFLADLRWCAGDDSAAAALHAAFLDGYGTAGADRRARAHAYDVLLQLRLAARRVPVAHPDWESRVASAIGRAEGTLARGA